MNQDIPLVKAHTGPGAITAEDRHAPGLIYTSEEIYQQEKDKIFMKDWLLVAREEELEKTGDYMAMEVMGERIFICRDQSGKLKALSNVCLHRGVELVKGSGNKRVFSCPFHGWTYDLQGKLIGAPEMQDRELNCKLPEIRVGTWKGWIFINFDEACRPLEEHVAVLEADFGYLRQEECRLAVKSVNEVNCNWKMVVENLIDFYHLNVVHTSTNGRTFSSDAFRFATRPNGGYLSEYNSGPATPSGRPVFGRMPWLEDKPESFSTSGRLWPNVTLFARVDTVHPMVVWPLSPTRAKVITYTLVPKTYFGQPDFEQRAEAYREYQNKVLAEDREMLDSVQGGVGSRRYVPGPMADVEIGVKHVINSFLERLNIPASTAAR